MGKGRKRIDLTGEVFTWLTVIEFSHTGEDRHTFWKCKCKCGNETIARAQDLKRGQKKSCGCLRGISSANNISLYKNRKRLASKYFD